MKSTRQPQPGHGLPPPAPLFKPGDRVQTPLGLGTIEIRNGRGWAREGWVFHVTTDVPFARNPEMPWNTDVEAMFYETEMSLLGSNPT